MAETAAAQSNTLAEGLVNRLNQLGMSRRELARRTGLSRQTIHNIEHEGMTNLKPSTFQALDQALKWASGTALALGLGKGTPETIEERLTHYLARIAVHLSHMDTEQLELTLIMMEEHELGKSVQTTDEFTRKVGKLVQKLLTDVAHLTGETIARNVS